MREIGTKILKYQEGAKRREHCTKILTEQKLKEQIRNEGLVLTKEIERLKEKNKMKNRQSHASGRFNTMAVNSIKF